MKNYTQIKHDYKLVDKTIFSATEHDGKLFLIFTDDTFAVIDPDTDDGVEVRYWEYNLTPNISNVFELYQAGFMNSEEYKTVYSRLIAEQAQETEKRELEALASLKAKYEK